MLDHSLKLAGTRRLKERVNDEFEALLSVGLCKFFVIQVSSSHLQDFA